MHLRPTGETFAVSRDDAGLADLVARLAGRASSPVVLEATGGFEVAVAAALAGNGLPLAVVNPRQIRALARALGRLAKTDPLYAEVIALFAERVRPEARPVPDEQACRLAEFVTRRRQLVGMIGAERNRHRRGRDGRLRRRIAARVARLRQALAEIERGLDDIVRGTPVWREREDLLTSRCPASARSPPARWWPSSRNSAESTAEVWPPWSGSRHSTGTAAPSGAAA